MKNEERERFFAGRKWRKLKRIEKGFGWYKVKLVRREEYYLYLSEKEQRLTGLRQAKFTCSGRYEESVFCSFYFYKSLYDFWHWGFFCSPFSENLGFWRQMNNERNTHEASEDGEDP